LNIVGLLLAAGSAKRFGSDKLRHVLPHGVTIAAQAARHLKSQVEIVAVVRPGSDELARALQDEGCKVVICDNAADGMGASLACAVRAAEAADAWLVALGDMPYVRPSSIAAVRAALEGGAALAAPYFHAVIRSASAQSSGRSCSPSAVTRARRRLFRVTVRVC
jgi:molybdenum cofactor cytidylyltransferase